MNLVLIGYRGTGKSTVAHALALRLNLEVVDADQLLELRAGTSIAQIFQRDGEARFRDLESEILAELCDGEQQIIASGGGVVLRAENRRKLQHVGTVVWLKASAEAIHARIDTDPLTAERRPNLTSRGGYEEITDLLAQRTPLYRQCADIEIETDGKTPEQIADEIVSLLQSS